MGQYSRRIYQGVFGTPNARQVIYPVVDAAGVGVALGAAGNSPAWSAWVDIALPALITVENFIVGFTLDTHSAACVATVDIGITLSLGVQYATAAAVTAAGALPIEGASRARTRQQLIAIAAGQGHYIKLAVPFLCPAGIGIIARWQTAAGAETANCTVATVTGI